MKSKKSLNGKFIGKTAAWLTGIFTVVAAPTYLIHQKFYADYQLDDVYVQRLARANGEDGQISAHLFNELNGTSNGWEQDPEWYWFRFDATDPKFSADNFERDMCFQPTVNGTDSSRTFDLVEINRIPCPAAE